MESHRYVAAKTGCGFRLFHTIAGRRNTLPLAIALFPPLLGNTHHHINNSTVFTGKVKDLMTLILTARAEIMLVFVERLLTISAPTVKLTGTAAHLSQALRDVRALSRASASTNQQQVRHFRSTSPAAESHPRCTATLPTRPRSRNRSKKKGRARLRFSHR